MVSCPYCINWSAKDTNGSVDSSTTVFPNMYFEEIDDRKAITLVGSDILKAKIEPLRISFGIEIVSQIQFVLKFAPEMRSSATWRSILSFLMFLLHLNRFHQIAALKPWFKNDGCIVGTMYCHSCLSTTFAISTDSRSNKLKRSFGENISSMSTSLT